MMLNAINFFVATQMDFVKLYCYICKVIKNYEAKHLKDKTRTCISHTVKG